MRIAMIGQKGIPAIYGGVERHVEELSLELAKKGHEVLVYARKWYAPKTAKIYGGVKIVHTPTLHTKHLDTIIHTFTATIHAMAQKPDVIHYHGVGPSLLSWIPRLFCRKTKVVTTFHCIDRYHQKWGILARLFLGMGEKAACAFAHETISVSKTIQNYCLNEYKRLTSFVPNGVRMPKREAGAIRLEEWGLQKNKYVLMVSRLVPHKGAHYLIEAWQNARSKNMDIFGDVKLVIVGGSSFTDEYVEALKTFARNDKSVVFTGWQKGESLEELYGNALLFVNPSENEGLPITVLQAMSYGRPTLVSDIPEHQEVVDDSRFWFANANINALSDRLTQLVMRPELLGQVGEKNKQHVAENYQWLELATKVEQVYHLPILKRHEKNLLAEAK